MSAEQWRRTGLAVGALQVAFGLLTVDAAPAAAECVQVDFEIHHADQPPTYPLGAPEYCAVPTWWEQSHEVHGGDDLSDPQPGTPKGFWLQVWIPTPT